MNTNLLQKAATYQAQLDYLNESIDEALEWRKDVERKLRIVKGTLLLSQTNGGSNE